MRLLNPACFIHLKMCGKREWREQEKWLKQCRCLSLIKIFRNCLNGYKIRSPSILTLNCLSLSQPQLKNNQKKSRLNPEPRPGLATREDAGIAVVPRCLLLQPSAMRTHGRTLPFSRAGGPRPKSKSERRWRNKMLQRTPHSWSAFCPLPLLPQREVLRLGRRYTHPTRGCAQPKMKIRKLKIENLRGLSHVECDFDQPTNVIVGPNAVGKTTILEAVRLAKGCCETSNFLNWWFKPVFSRRMVLEGVGFGVAGLTAVPATRQDRRHCRWPMSPPAGWTSIDHSQCTAEDQRLPQSSASRRLHASDNRNGGRVGCRFCRSGEP